MNRDRRELLTVAMVLLGFVAVQAWTGWRLIIAIVASAVAFGLLAWWTRPHPTPPDHCEHCGYNLKRNVSGTRPECGRAVGCS